MDDKCFTIDLPRDKLNTEYNSIIKNLEQGKVVFLPNLPFVVKQQHYTLLTDSILDGSHKNISFNYLTNQLGGHKKTIPSNDLSDFMHAFAEYAYELVKSLFPSYQNDLKWGRTSYRPAEIKGRPSSKRKDDTRVHVDAFPSTPVNGLRILRIFCNINPHGKPRTWHIGEPLSAVLEHFAHKMPVYNPLKAKLLHWVKATKSLRTAYDHYMLHLHDAMKLDDNYQSTVKKTPVEFPANSTWIVFTDQVSHAALGGQYLLEQTFYLPVEAMADKQHSPLQHWKTYANV